MNYLTGFPYERVLTIILVFLLGIFAVKNWRLQEEVNGHTQCWNEYSKCLEAVDFHRQDARVSYKDLRSCQKDMNAIKQKIGESQDEIDNVLKEIAERKKSKQIAKFLDKYAEGMRNGSIVG